MKKTISFALILIWLGSLSAQSFVGRNNYHLESSPRFSNSSDTLKILAVMVEFQKDNDRNTYGNGKFGSIYSQNYGTEIIDPLPFDANYFSNHLEFAKNYFKKVSNGKLNIVYKILPQVITVPDSMRNYSPPPQNASDFSGLGKFTKEVWQLADAAFPDEDFSKYNLFTIFHAGVGREAPKLSSIESERDLPSVYLGLKSFQSILGSDFNGFPVDGGKFLITNTMILPSTESHEESTFSGTMLVKTTINGILVGNIGTYLGLPDLFNTVTGVSSVGRFGLMDGDALFAYSGLFPPEPSAWEKVFLGWATPVTLSIGDKNVNLAARIAATLNDTTILKIPINSTEYFLIENRERDVNKDGLVITAKEGSQTFTFNIDRDKGKFQWYQVDTLKGVITDVDEPDWAAPGNGIVIWHIDDNIINANIADDKINADDNHRGIYVEEADGIFDIGKKITTLLGEDYGRAAQEDMWYAGNKGKYFKNIFGPDSKPNTNSNTGANSLITMQNFSAAANKMGFNVSFGNDLVKPIQSIRLNLGNQKKTLNFLRKLHTIKIILTDGTKLLIDDLTANSIQSINDFSEFRPITSVSKIDDEFYIGAVGNVLNVYYADSTNQYYHSYKLPYTITCPPTFAYNAAGLLVGCSDGRVRRIDLGQLLNNNKIVQIDSTFSINQPIKQIVARYINYSFMSGSILASSTGEQLTFAHPLKMAISILRPDERIVLLAGQNIFYVIRNNQIETSFQINSTNEINSFSIGDVLTNGNFGIVVANGANIEAYNFQGVLADNFPFVNNNGKLFVNDILSFTPGVVATSSDGEIYLINSSGKVVNGFPISNGVQNMVSQVLGYSGFSDQPTGNPTTLAVLGSDNRLNVWSIGIPSFPFWASYYGDSYNRSIVQGTPSSQNKTQDFFPMSKAYNWPNPVYGSETKIRYYVNENSDVNIKIFDLAGELVAELNSKATGGMDNETTWNVSKVQSGIYYAHLEVKGGSGASASKIIKIAVIK
ncbi:MAG: T9SS type A sorting domain-containing protein [Bacteroidetes bacterium]|nr:T9SS type A sorting domain-containing protein [Bacteroidota bacterium]